jgi:hypothetical protein
MTEEQEDGGKEIYNGLKSGSNSGSNIPLLQNGGMGIALWVNVDKNGNYYLSVQVPLIRNFNVFVTDRFKTEFNELINHLISEGKLSKEAMKGGDDDE